jgi:predicted AlkP superfamily phosphohydrolase/phosphomutase
MKRRVFLLGLDGASWNVLDRMFDSGYMPTLQRLCAEGVRATLASTLPPITPVAWSSLMTGVNPGKHGIFGFTKNAPDNSYLAEPVNRLDISVPTIFDYYREGPPLVSLNLPMSYPATEMNGYMVTGMMTPLNDLARADHPRGFLDELRQEGINYKIDPKFEAPDSENVKAMFEGWQSSGHEFVNLLTAITDSRMQAVHWMLDRADWDVFICVIVGMDRLQHLHWDRLVPADGSPPAEVLASYYSRVDEHIAKLTAALDPGDTLLIISDHGFVKHHGQFNANEWLLRQGWLQRREARRSPLYPVKKLFNALGITRGHLTRLLGDRGAKKIQLMAAHVDWARSEAYLSSPFGIRLNLQGRETLGCIEPAQFESLRSEIMQALTELSGADGETLIAHVRRGDECYHGDARREAADIVFTFQDDRNYSSYVGNLAADIFTETPQKSGDHRVDGILVAWGGGITPSADMPRYRIWDVLPTIMHLNRRAVPEICDGRVLGEILGESRPIEVDRQWRRFLPDRQRISYDQDQKKEIAARLRALGYLGDDD